MASDIKVRKSTISDVGALLDAGDGAVVTLVVGDTQLAVHRAVLTARSPVFEAMFKHDMLEASSGRVTISDIEGPVLRQLVAYCYTSRAQQLPSMALQLLTAADKYGLCGLRTQCEQQAATRLAAENAAEAAVIAVRHRCPKLTAASVDFIKDHFVDVVGTQGWAHMMRNYTEDLVEVSALLAKPPPENRIINMVPDIKVKETLVMDLGALLDAGDGAVVTLVVGDTHLAVHRAVLTARSPVFEAMFKHDIVAPSSLQVTIPDIEGPVLRQLLAYCYTLKAPRLASIAIKLLAVADKYGLSSLKTQCEEQVVADLGVGNAAAAAVLAVRHTCPNLTEAAVAFIKAHFAHVVGTKGWADAMRNQPEYLIEVSRLLAEPPAEIRSLSREERDRRLIQAAKKGSWEQLQLLIVAGADVEVRDKNTCSFTALYWAAMGGHLDVVRCLLEGGAEVDARDSRQYTPLHVAAVNGHVSVVRLLLASSADPNSRCSEGSTALHWAAEPGHSEVVEALLEAGAESRVVDNKGKSPLDLATEKNYHEVIELLLQS